MKAEVRIAAARRRLLALKARHEAGTIEAAQYDVERSRIEREIGDAIVGAPAEPAEPVAATEAAASAAGRPSKRLVAGTALFVFAVAIGGYALTGSPTLAGLRAADAKPGTAMPAAAPGPAASDSREIGLQQIAGMVETLAQRMKERPDDAEGWTMLARSYTVLGRYADALPAYRRAAELQPANASLLADYADAVAATKGNVINPESAALIERALAVDPKNPKALALAGTVAYERGDYAGAIVRWQRILEGVPAGSELAKQVQSSVDEARARLGPGAAALPAARAATPASAATAAAATARVVTPAAEASVAGTVTLAPELVAQASKDDTVFVFARPEGGRMPLAVLRAKVADLPLTFKLDDSMAMAPTAPRLSGAKSVVVGARISKSGNAIAQPGDLAGEAAAPVAPGAKGIVIRIGKVVGER